MENKNMLGGIVSLAVVVICVAAIMMPILDDATTTHKTFDNTDYGYYQMKALEEGDVWTYSNSIWSYDGTALTSSSNNDVSIVATDNLVIRQSGLIRGGTYSSNVSTSAEVVAVDDGTALYINSTTNVAYTEGYGAIAEGDYILKTYTDSAYVLGDTALWVSGVTRLGTVAATDAFIHITGTINDGFTITATTVGNSTAMTDITIGEYTVNYAAVEGYDDLYTITSIVFPISATYDSGTVNTTATYSTFILPTEITAEKTVHFNDGENALLAAIPVLVIVSLVVAAVGTFIAARRD